jgi:hypothetical protein
MLVSLHIVDQMNCPRESLLKNENEPAIEDRGHSDQRITRSDFVKLGGEIKLMQTVESLADDLYRLYAFVEKEI